MSVTKNGKLNCSKEDIEFASFGISALEYALSQGYDLVKTGNTEYRMREHDSMVFRTNGKWHWNSQNLSGNAINFAMSYENLSFVEAVLKLNGKDIHHNIETVRKTIANHPPVIKPFTLPERSKDQLRLRDYLCHTRYIDIDLVRMLYKENKIYQTTPYNNIAFVGTDYENKPVSAFLRGSTTDSFFKREAPNGDKRNFPSFHWGNTDSKNLLVFESAIDLMSYVSIFKQMLSFDTQKDIASYMAIGGLFKESIENHLKHCPNIEKIYFCVDNDEAGINFTKSTMPYFRDLGYTCTRTVPEAKDFNELLISMKTKKTSKEHTQNHEHIQDQETDLEQEI